MKTLLFSLLAFGLTLGAIALDSAQFSAEMLVPALAIAALFAQAANDAPKAARLPLAPRGETSQIHRLAPARSLDLAA